MWRLVCPCWWGVCLRGIWLPLPTDPSTTHSDERSKVRGCPGYILDFLYFGETNIFQDNLDSSLVISVWRYLKCLTIPIPIPFSGNKYFRYRYRYFFRYQIFQNLFPDIFLIFPNFTDAGSKTFFRYEKFPVPVPIRYQYLLKWLDALRGSSPARQINCTTPCNLCNTMQYHNK